MKSAETAKQRREADDHAHPGWLEGVCHHPREAPESHPYWITQKVLDLITQLQMTGSGTRQLVA